MPIGPGEHADLLRAIGRLLDSEGAESVQLVNNEAFLTISWRSKSRGNDERHYQDHNLEELRKAAKDSRGDIRIPTSPSGSLADLFRTLGQDLDRERADFTQIIQEADGLVVSGSIEGRYMRRKYFTSDLVASSQRRRAWRRGGPGAGASAEPNLSWPPTQEPPPTPGTGYQGPTDDDGPLARRLRR